MASNEFDRCDATNAGVKCTASSKEPLCKDPIANPATRFSFDPDNCLAISSSVLQTALEELCDSTSRVMCATVAAGQVFGPTAVPITLVLPDVVVQKVLGTDITVTTPQIILGSTGTYYVEATLAYQTTALAAPGVLGFRLQQGNTSLAGFSNVDCISGFADIEGDEQDGTIKIQGIVCSTLLTTNARDNELRLIVTSGTGLTGTILVPATIVVHKISAVACTRA